MTANVTPGGQAQSLALASGAKASARTIVPGRAILAITFLPDAGLPAITLLYGVVSYTAADRLVTLQNLEALLLRPF